MRLLRLFLWTLLGVTVVAGGTLLGGSRLLIASEPLPAKVDAVVVLQGSVLGEEARVAGAIRLLQQGKTDRILLSIPKETYWGQRVAPIAYDFLTRTYGAEATKHITFCESFDVDSTEQEAKALTDCIRERDWRSIVVVTSDYHTRRAGIIWRRAAKEQHLRVELCMHGVPDPEFQGPSWWRDRRSAKTWLMEFTKLVWMLFGG